SSHFLLFSPRAITSSTMDYDLPQFEPVDLPLIISDAEILCERQLRLENTDIANAEALCYAGDASAATANINVPLHVASHPS
ncbi:hypothetical protein LTR81_023639, partial [Elasticomyces elasticus]